jgi:hypothetical protein
MTAAPLKTANPGEQQLPWPQWTSRRKWGQLLGAALG